MDEFGYHELARMAMGFVLEDESWPVFLAWVKDQHVSPESHEWLASASLPETRRLWMEHGPDGYGVQAVPSG